MSLSILAWYFKPMVYLLLANLLLMVLEFISFGSFVGCACSGFFPFYYPLFQ
jgi:uncharacterized membrane protein